MGLLYLRTMYLFDVISGGSIGHTAGVINALDRAVDLEVVSNSKLPGIKKEIRIIKPIRVPLIGEFLYNIKLLLMLCKKADYDTIYQRHSYLSFVSAFLAKKYKVSFILEYNGSEIWILKRWTKIEKSLKGVFKFVYRYLVEIHLVSIIEKYNLNNASIIVAVSDPMREVLIKRGVDKKKIKNLIRRKKSSQLWYLLNFALWWKEYIKS